MRRENEESAASVIGRLAGRMILTAAMVLLLFIAATRAYQFGREIFYQEPAEEAPGRDVEISLAEGAVWQDLAAELYSKGLIRNETALAIQARIYQTDLYPGTYELNTSMTTKEILQSISSAAAEKRAEAESAAAEAETEAEAVLGAGEEEDGTAAADTASEDTAAGDTSAVDTADGDTADMDTAAGGSAAEAADGSGTDR